ncbi:MAG: hypothetical protein IPN79_00425 [Saprospiraceae bacterium]|nr:hypothetical protein [Saprospiraceae bacterium]
MSGITYKHIKFWMIATKHAKDALVIAGNIKSMATLAKIKCKWYQQRELKRNLRRYQDCSQHIDIIISMCAFCLESFINFYAIHFELDQSPGYDERIPSVRKWKLYSQLTVNRMPDEAFLARIQKIMEDKIK